MAIVVSQAYALASTEGTSADLPRIGYHDLVTFSNIVATQENASYPATNLSNAQTNSLWKSGSTSAQKLTALHSYTDPIDYVGIVRHNFGTGGVTVRVETLDPGGDDTDDNDWTEVVGDFIPANDTPIFIIFTENTNNGVRIVLTPDAVEPQAARFMTGKTIVLPYGLPVGHTPITYGRTADAFTGTAESGDFLGAVELTARLSSSIEQRDLDQDWYRTNLQPLATAGRLATFMWAWSPQDYPLEVGYCWTKNDPQPRISREVGLVDITFDIGGIAV